MTDGEKRIIDHASTKAEAIKLRDMYVGMTAVLAIKDWLIGYERDPVAGPDGKHGYQIYAVPRD